MAEIEWNFNVNESQIKIISRAVLLIIGFIKYFALTFLLIDVFSTILLVSLGTDFEFYIIRSVEFVLGIKESSYTLGSGDILSLFIILNSFVMAFFTVVKKVMSINIRLFWVVSFVLVFLVIIHIVQGVLLESFIVPVVFFVLSCISLFWFVTIGFIESSLQKKFKQS